MSKRLQLSDEELDLLVKALKTVVSKEWFEIRSTRYSGRVAYDRIKRLAGRLGSTWKSYEEFIQK